MSGFFKKPGFLLLGLILIFGLGTFFIAHRMLSPKTGSSETKNVQLQLNVPETKTAQISVFNQEGQQSNPNLKNSAFTQDAKIKLNLHALLLRNEKFRVANPDLTLEKFLSGSIQLRDIKIPSGIALSYEIDPSCKNKNHELLSNLSAETEVLRNFGEGIPAFLSSVTQSASTVQHLAERFRHDTCILNVTFDDLKTFANSKLRSVSSVSSSIQPSLDATPGQDKALVDRVIVEALATQGKAIMVVVGINKELRRNYPGLISESGDPRRTTQGEYLLQKPGKNAANDVVKVNIGRRPFPITAGENGFIKDSSISNAILFAAGHNATIVNVVVSGFDPLNFQPAIEFATRRGTLVVAHMPVPILKTPMVKAE